MNIFDKYFPSLSGLPDLTRKTKIKLLTVIIGLLAILMVAQFFLAIYDNAKYTKNLDFVSKANMQAHYMSASLYEFYNTLKVLTAIIETNRRNGIQDRILTTEIIRKFLEQNRDVYGITIAYEPDEFDGRDSEFTQDSACDENGTFVPYVWRNNGEITISASYKNDTRQWYDNYKKNAAVLLTEPSKYIIDDNEIYIMSVWMPIYNENLNYIGMGGIDYQMTFFEDFLKKSPVDNCNSFILTGTGRLVAANCRIDSKYDAEFVKNSAPFKSIVDAVAQKNSSDIIAGHIDNMNILLIPIASEIQNGVIILGYVFPDYSLYDVFDSNLFNYNLFLFLLISILILSFLLLKILFRRTIDALTEVYTRDIIKENLPREIKKAVKHNLNLSVIIADIDHFKKVNDTYGHLCGDCVLKLFAAILKKHVRKTDWVARFGGEEFLICLKGVSKSSALSIAERIRKEVAETTFIFNDNSIKITVSLGVTDIKSIDCVTAQNLIDEADRLMYSAKKAGRNTVR